MAENLNIKELIQSYRHAYPELRTLTDAQILSVLNDSAAGVNLNEDQQISMFGLAEQGYSGFGLEKTAQPSLTMPEKGTLEAALRERINKVSEGTKAVEEKNGFIGSAWSWMKNNLLDFCTDSTNDIEKAKTKDLAALDSGNIEVAFKEITGLDYTPENVNKFLNNEVKTTSEQALEGYKEGQDMVVDITGDIVSGIAAVCIYTVAVGAAPFTGGASIAVGLGAATLAGGLIKTGVKYADAKSVNNPAGTTALLIGTALAPFTGGASLLLGYGALAGSSAIGNKGREYDSFGHDMITGGFSGILAPVTGGMGGAVGKTVATKLGVQAVKEVGKGAAESGIKAILTNPTGYQYVGGSILKRGLSLGTEMAVDGALGGAIDGGFRNGVEQYEKTGEVHFDEVLGATVEGGIGGAVLSPVIGGGMKASGKLGSKLLGKNADSVNAHPRWELPENVSKLEDFLSVSKLTDSEADLVLKNAGLSEAQISLLRTECANLNQCVDAMQTITKFAPEGDINLNKMSVDEIVDFIDEAQTPENIHLVNFVNEENAILMQKYLCKGDEDPCQLLLDVCQLSMKDKNFYRNLNKANEISQIADAPMGSILDKLRWGYDDSFHLLTPERIRTQAQLDKVFGDTNFSLDKCTEIVDPSKITPEFLAQLEKEVQRAKKMGVDPQYGWNSPHAADPTTYLPMCKSILDNLEKLELDLSFGQYGIEEIEKLLNGKDAKAIQNIKTFLANCSDECKSKYRNDIWNIISRDLDEVNAKSYSEFFNTVNELKCPEAIKYNMRNPACFMQDLMKKFEVTDFHGVSKLLKAFEDTETWPSEYRLAETLKIKDGDYDSAAMFLRELKDFWGDSSLTHSGYKEVDDFLTYSWKSVTDFKNALETLQKLKQAGISSNEVYGRLLSLMISSEASEGVEKYAIAKKYGFSNDSMLCDLLRDSSITAKQQKQVMESMISDIRKQLDPSLQDIDKQILTKVICGGDDYFEYVIIDMLSNNLSFSQALQNRGKSFESISDNLSHIFKPEIKEFVSDIVKRRRDLAIDDRELIGILQATTLQNNSLSRQLCEDVSLPRELITKILYATKPETLSFAQKLCADSSIPHEFIDKILFVTKPEKMPFAKKLCSDVSFPREHIANIVDATTPETMHFAEKLCSEASFPREHIASIVGATKPEKMPFAKKLCSDVSFPREYIANIVGATTPEKMHFAEKLCSEVSFPREHIANILRFTTPEKMPFVEKLCSDVSFPREYIADIVESITPETLCLAEKLCSNVSFPREHIADIVRYTEPESISLAQRLCSDTSFTPEEVKDILREVTSANVQLAEEACKHSEIAKKVKNILNSTKINDVNDAGGNNGKIDDKRVARYTKMLQDSKVSPFVIKHLNDGMDMHDIALLVTTKRNKDSMLSAGSKTVVSASNNNLNETISGFIAMGLTEKEANSIFKAISKGGVVDSTLEQVATELIQRGVAKNKIGDILNSAQITGSFNRKIVDDYLKIQGLGLNPLLEKNIAVLNNISAGDVALKFNSKAKKQLKGMLSGLSESNKQILQQKGIDIDAVINKLNTEIVQNSNKIAPRVKVVSGMRTKSSITGFERVLIDRYNPNQKIWADAAASKSWAEEKYLGFRNTEYVSTRVSAQEPGLPEKITKLRAEKLREWFDFLETDEIVKNDPFARTIIADFITKDLLPENSSLPPVLDKSLIKEILADAADSNSFSISSVYNKKLSQRAQANSSGESVEFDGIKGVWHTVPQTDSSSPLFKENAAKIRTFSDGTNWCIRTWNAESYLQKGAMHFFVDENGLTQICIREDAPRRIAEIQKRQQNATRPIPYINGIQQFIERHELKAPRGYLDDALKAKPDFDALKAKCLKLASDKDYKAILEQMGITVTVLQDNTWELSHYSPMLKEFSLNDIGIKENDLLENVSIIRGDASFKDSNVGVLRNLREVHGVLSYDESHFFNMPKLEFVNGHKIEW